MNIVCWECGKPATVGRAYGLREGESIKELAKPNQYKRCYCDECFKLYKAEVEERQKQMIVLKKETMFENAMRSLEEQRFNFYKNKDVVDAVHDKFRSDPDKFDSSQEVIAAIILVKNRIYAKMQYKIDRYQVDFLLPDMHLVLEIDGDRHDLKRGKDSVRDENIKYMLGKDWEVVRIPAKYMDVDAEKLLYAIDIVLKSRQDGKVNWRAIYKDS